MASDLLLELDTDKLRLLRWNTGLGLREFARRTKTANGKSVAHSNLSLYERGLRRPTPESLKAIADLLGVQPSDLLRRRRDAA